MFPLLVYVTVLLVATCGLVFEFVAATLASYLMGGGVTQFSLVVGAFLTAMGVGAYLSRFVQREVARRFIEVEITAALVGGLTTPILFVSFARGASFQAALYTLVLVQGCLVGLEIPLVVRMLRKRVKFSQLVSRALAFDYLGSLVAGVLFALVLLPHLGLMRTGLVFGIINGLVGLAGTWLFASSLAEHARLRGMALAVLGVLAAALVFSEQLTRSAETLLYADNIVYAKQSRFQRIVLTSGRGGFHLFLDGNLQLSSLDEYRYHEALVHPAFVATTHRKRVLVLGGGDGLAVREVLRHRDVEHVALVDIDPEMTNLGTHHPVLLNLNQGALSDPRVRIINDDAMAWLAEASESYDIAIVDFPDPNNYALGKLYTTRFYRLLLGRLEPHGMIAVQATSPLAARQSFWCIVGTLESAGLRARPYHVAVPSFGEWGYVLASRSEPAIVGTLFPGLRYLADDVLPTLFVIPPDMSRVPVEVNRLSTQVLVRYYESEWRKLL